MTNLIKQLHALPTENHNWKCPGASSGNMNAPREWQRCEQAAGWIWLVHAASNEGKMILRKWETLANATTYLADCTLCLSAFRKDVLLTMPTHVEKECVHVPTFACAPHYLYKMCGCMHILNMNQIFHFYVSAEGQEKSPEGQRELQMDKNTDLFWESTWTTWKPC